MPYFTTDQIREKSVQILAKSNRQANFSMASERLNEDSRSRRMSPVPAEPGEKPTVTLDIFLAHSSLDSLQVLGLYHLLSDRGYSVYLDQVCDPQLDRTNVTRETARVLRYRLALCRSLFVATSINTPQTKWVPWELGFTDGYSGKVAIMPLLQAGQTTFSGQEYFELYPQVRDSPGHSRPYDMDIYDRGAFVSGWGPWITQSRKF